MGSTHAYTCEFKRNLTVRIPGAACLLSNMGFQQDRKRKLDKCGAAASVHQIGIKISICGQCKLQDVQPRLDLELFVIKPTTRVVKFQVSTVTFSACLGAYFYIPFFRRENDGSLRVKMTQCHPMSGCVESFRSNDPTLWNSQISGRFIRKGSHPACPHAR